MQIPALSDNNNVINTQETHLVIVFLIENSLMSQLRSSSNIRGKAVTKVGRNFSLEMEIVKYLILDLRWRPVKDLWP